MVPANRFMPLQLDRVCYRQKQLTLLDKITFTLSNNGITVILGHNGAGKSLLLKLIHGVLTPTSGHICWHEDPPSVHQYWRALLLQRPSFLDSSVEQNLHFVMRVAGVSKSGRQSRCEQVLQKCGLEHLRRRNSNVLSGGEQQRLSIARALVVDASVVLLDEPTVALDPTASVTIENLVKTMHAEGKKVVMTTHDIPQARRLADDILFLREGRLLRQSNANTFFADETHTDIISFIQ